MHYRLGVVSSMELELPLCPEKAGMIIIIWFDYYVIEKGENKEMIQARHSLGPFTPSP